MEKLFTFSALLDRTIGGGPRGKESPLPCLAPFAVALGSRCSCRLFLGYLGEAICNLSCSVSGRDFLVC